MQGLTSQASLQPYCLPVTPTINKLFGMHIFCDCKTMAEAIGRKACCEKNQVHIDPIICEKYFIVIVQMGILYC